MERIKVLSTRILPATVKEKAEENNISLTQKDFIRTEPVSDAITEQKILHQFKNSTHFIFTSASAVEMVGQVLQAKQVIIKDKSFFCLSGKTKQSIEHYFPGNNINSNAINGKELAAIIIKTGIKRLAFFCGNIRRNEIPDTLSANGISLEEIVVYKTIEQKVLINEEFNAIMFFSPSGVDSFFKYNQAGKASFFAIGDTTARTISKYSNNTIITSVVPDSSAMLQQVVEHFRIKTA